MNTTTVKRQVLFCNYYEQWITVYKEGAIRPVTMKKIQDGASVAFKTCTRYVAGRPGSNIISEAAE